MLGAAVMTCSKLSTSSKSSELGQRPNQLFLGIRADLGDLERFEDRACHKGRVAKVRDRGYRRPVLKLGGEAPDELERKPGLADAAGSGERDQPCVLVPHDFRDCGELAFTTEKRCGRNRRPPRRRRASLRDIQ